jgi:hypothetical protein
MAGSSEGQTVLASGSHYALKPLPGYFESYRDLQQLIRRKLKTVVLENECIARVYHCGRGADDGGRWEHLAIGSNLCICDAPNGNQNGASL